MAVTTERSAALQSQEGTSTTPLTFLQGNRRVAMEPFAFTQGAAAGDATSTAGLSKMPAGKHTLMGIAIWTSAFGASRVFDIGYEAHTTTAGAAVAASAAAFKNDLDVAAATTTITPTFIPLAINMDSSAGYVISGTVAGGTIPAGATVTGWAVYAY
jgi:hypothetical protein